MKRLQKAATIFVVLVVAVTVVLFSYVSLTGKVKDEEWQGGPAKGPTSVKSVGPEDDYDHSPDASLSGRLSRERQGSKQKRSR